MMCGMARGKLSHSAKKRMIAGLFAAGKCPGHRCVKNLSDSPSDSRHHQIVIIGGGIAGLWLLNSLHAAGYQVVLLDQSLDQLLEQRPLGVTQTLASQGIIHGGLKYALNGVLSPAASAIADMPTRWRACLAGTGEIDLRQCRLLSENYYMWSGDGYRARLKSFLGSKALRGRITALDSEARPRFFREQKLGGTVYQLADFVLDVPSLMQTLAAPHHARIVHTRDVQLRDAHTVSAAEQTFTADRVVLCAGQGNAALLAQLGLQTPAMQRRPLHMVTVSHVYPHPLNTHCIGHDFGMTPRMTITTHPLADGRNLWYLGGELAESGVQRSEEAQIDFARAELASLFPSLSLPEAEWQTLRIDRAEPATHTGQRPDSAFVVQEHGLIVAWPVKLTLAPDLGDATLALLAQEGSDHG